MKSKKLPGHGDEHRPDQPRAPEQAQTARSALQRLRPRQLRLSGDAQETERRGEEREHIRQDGAGSRERLHQVAAEPRTADVRGGAAAVHEGVRGQEVAPRDQRDQQRPVGHVEEHRERAGGEGDGDELSEGQDAEGGRDRDGRQHEGPAEVGRDHQPPPVAGPVRPGARGEGKDERRQILGRREVAECGGPRVQHEHRGQGQCEQRDLVAEERDRTAGPVAAEGAITQ